MLVKGGDVIPGVPLDSVTVAIGVVLLADSVVDVRVPGTVELPVRAGGEVVPVRAVDVTLVSPEG